ncbi:hypothetical protein Tco_0626097 [Tanacetum coccineum]|uniref:Xylulose kinase-1 n=1 Tax=Tanacetum coccineum TaxID=301880 RepID=A0ABQ4WIM5_9ASTR
MHYRLPIPIKLAIVLQKAKQIQDFGPTSGIRASRGTLNASDNGIATNKPKQQQQLIPITTTISNIKLPILRRRSMIYGPGDGADGVVRVLPPVSAAEIHAVEKERKARTILLMAIPKEHLRRFHGMDDAKEIWEAIRTRFQQLLSQLEAHGAEVSTEDANHKFLRSLPLAWSNPGFSTSKVGLGYEIKSNDEVLSYEEEMNRTVFNCTEEDFIDKPLYSRFSKTDSFKGGPQKPETSVSDDTFSENSVTTNEKVVSEPKPKEVEPSCAELKKQRVFNTGNGVAKPVWNNANRVNHANHFVPRPVQLIAVRQNVNSVRPNVNTGRANVNSVRQNVNSVRSNVNTGSFNINTVKAKQPIHTSNSNSFSPVRPQVNKFNQRSNFSKSHSPVRRPIVRNTAKMSYTHAVKGNWGTAIKTSAGYNWRKTRPNSNCNSGSNFIRTDHPHKNKETDVYLIIRCSGQHDWQNYEAKPVKRSTFKVFRNDYTLLPAKGKLTQIVTSGQTLKENHNRGVSILGSNNFMAMQETNNSGYLYNRS